MTARFAASKAAAAAARLRPPFIAIVPGTKRPGAPGTASEVIRVDDGCSCTADVTCAACLLTRAAEAAYGRRVAHDYLGICAMIGHHYDPELLANCPEPTATIAPCEEPAFCTHARPAENCVIHASRLSQSKMPAKRALQIVPRIPRQDRPRSLPIQPEGGRGREGLQSRGDEDRRERSNGHGVEKASGS